MENKSVYRLRSLDKLLGDFNELERQTIFFAPFSELNDPMEGSVDMLWHGDSIVWRNFFKHFLLCMEFKVSLGTIYRPEDSKKFYQHELTIMICEQQLPTDHYRQYFDIIKKRFFSYEIVTLLIEYLGKKKYPIQKKQLSAILSLISGYALESILYGHNEANFQPQPFWEELRDKIANSNSKQLEVVAKHFEKINLSDNEEKAIDTVWENFSDILQQTELMNLCKLGDSVSKINWLYFGTNFIREYIEQVPQLVFRNWYSASFLSEFPQNSVLWGHYTDSHSGVCLIFKANETSSKDLNIPLRNPDEESERGFALRNYPFKNIIYSDKREEPIEFFRRLWTLPGGVVHKEWYTDEEGKVSPDIDKLFSTEEMRQAHWSQLDRIQTTKSKDWSYEKECRILIDDSFYNFSEQSKRAFTYDFSELQGIIFGMKTPVCEKVKIIRIISQNAKKQTELILNSINQDTKTEVILLLAMS